MYNYGCILVALCFQDAEDNVYGKSFLIGCQNEEQREFLATHDTSKTLFLEGPFNIWMNHIKEQYFVLRSEPLHIENPLTHEDDTRIREGMVWITYIIFISFEPSKILIKLDAQHISCKFMHLEDRGGKHFDSY